MNDAARCYLNGHAYWLLRGQGLNAQTVAGRLQGMNRAEKHELLFQHGINFDALPTWQKRGFGVYWRERHIVGYNPLTKSETLARRRSLYTDDQLPWKEDYAAAIRRLLAGLEFQAAASDLRSSPYPPWRGGPSGSSHKKKAACAAWF